MDKRVTTRITSSPAEPDSRSPLTKNDSFLEDMELSSHNATIHISDAESKRYVTTRTLSPVVRPFATVTEEQDSSDQKGNENIAYLKVPQSRKSVRSEASSNDKTKTGVTSKELKLKIQESKTRSQDNKTKSKPGDTKTTESQTKSQSEPTKLNQQRRSLVKDSGRRSGNYREADQNAEASKENKQPSNSHTRSNSSAEPSRDQPRRSDGGKKIDSKEIPESVALLSAVEGIIRIHTEKEGTKILRELHDLHILSQATLLKNLMHTTDEIRKDLQLGENLGQLKVLTAENERLGENFAILKMKYDDLRGRLEESENIKEENARLKLRLQELERRQSN